MYTLRGPVWDVILHTSFTRWKCYKKSRNQNNLFATNFHIMKRGAEEDKVFGLNKWAEHQWVLFPTKIYLTQSVIIIDFKWIGNFDIFEHDCWNSAPERWSYENTEAVKPPQVVGRNQFKFKKFLVYEMGQPSGENLLDRNQSIRTSVHLRRAFHHSFY